MVTTHAREATRGLDELDPAELRRRGTRKWSEYGDDVLPAWIAEMDFPTAPAIREALGAAVERSETGYAPEPEGCGLLAACAAWLQGCFGLQVEARQIRVLPDVIRGVQLGIELFSRSESPVVLPTPAYPPFFEAVRGAGRAIVETPMALEGGRWTFDLDRIETVLRMGTGTVILCNPYNPLGRVFRREELLELAETVERHGARVIADEVHAPLIYPPATHVSYSTVSEAAAHHSITLTSASKGWNVAGLKCAQIVLTNGTDLEIWDALPALRTYGTSVLGIVANRAAYEGGQAWLDEVVAYLDESRTLLADLVATHLPGVRCTVPDATYLAWLDCTELGLDDPAGHFLDRAKVALSPGVAFGSPGRGHVRLNFGTSRAILTEIVERMGRAV